MESLILDNSLSRDAIEIAKVIGKELLRWFADVAIFLEIFIIVLGAWMLWEEGVTPADEAQREEIWEMLRGEIMRGGDVNDVEGSEGREERRRWFLERLVDLEDETSGRGKEKEAAGDGKEEKERLNVFTYLVMKRMRGVKRSRPRTGRSANRNFCRKCGISVIRKNVIRRGMFSFRALRRMGGINGRYVFGCFYPKAFGYRLAAQFNIFKYSQTMISPVYIKHILPVRVTANFSKALTLEKGNKVFNNESGMIVIGQIISSDQTRLQSRKKITI
jgi:hypothetical protein